MDPSGPWKSRGSSGGPHRWTSAGRWSPPAAGGGSSAPGESSAAPPPGTSGRTAASPAHTWRGRGGSHVTGTSQKGSYWILNSKNRAAEIHLFIPGREGSHYRQVSWRVFNLNRIAEIHLCIPGRWGGGGHIIGRFPEGFLFKQDCRNTPVYTWGSQHMTTSTQAVFVHDF